MSPPRSMGARKCSMDLLADAARSEMIRVRTRKLELFAKPELAPTATKLILKNGA